VNRRPVSQKRAWRRYVERRRGELHVTFPCAMTTRRAVCPRHGTRVPQQAHVRKYNRDRKDWIRVPVPLTGICKPCRDELYEQLAFEYIRDREEKIMSASPDSPAEEDRPATSVLRESGPVHVLGQLELFDADGRPSKYRDKTEEEEAINDAA
jgi:hypothetical protein